MAQFMVADHLGVTLEVVRSMSIDEFLGWLEWIKLSRPKSTGPGRKGRKGGM